MTRTPIRLLLLATSLFSGGIALAHDGKPHGPQVAAATELKAFGDLPHAAAAQAGDVVPLWAETGGVRFSVTTSNPLAQRYFDQGLAFAYGFNHAEARRSFQAAQRQDPLCAMCFWGEALVLGPNINAPMAAEANAPALAALRRAQSLAATAGPKERTLIAALAARYSADPGADRAQLDAAYAEAMAEAARQWPNDHDIAALYAEALMDLSPWDYWADGGKTPKGRTAEIVAQLEKVLAADPDHIGAIHLYIHAVEASDRPQRSEPYADRMAKMNLAMGHLVHMPSHTYYRIGRYKDSLEANRRAVAADEAFFAKVKAEGVYAGGYYPHNIHFLLVSAQMAGDGRTAIEAAEKLEKAVNDDIARAVAWIQPIKAAPLFAYAQFAEPGRVLALAEPTGDMPYVNAMWHYARGTAFAARRDFAAARAEADEIARIAADPAVEGLVAGGLPAPDLLAIARHVVLARIAQGQGDLEAAIDGFRAAVAIQDTLPYMEPPFWYYPVRQSLGAALLLAGDTAGAEQAFSASLKTAPNNGWACFGMLEVHRRNQNVREAEQLKARLDRTWAGEPSLLDLRKL